LPKQSPRNKDGFPQLADCFPGLRRQRLPRLPWRPPRHAVPQARGGRQGRRWKTLAMMVNMFFVIVQVKDKRLERTTSNDFTDFFDAHF
jgi:hypothetical protein